MSTLKISYLAVGAYFTFVVGSSLLVGLLPALVNLPECDPTDSRILLKVDENLGVNAVQYIESEPLQQEFEEEENPVRHKRSALFGQEKSRVQDKINGAFKSPINSVLNKKTVLNKHESH